MCVEHAWWGFGVGQGRHSCERDAPRASGRAEATEAKGNAGQCEENDPPNASSGFVPRPRVQIDVTTDGTHQRRKYSRQPRQ